MAAFQPPPPGVMLFDSEEPKTMLVKGEVPMPYSWTSTGKGVGNPEEAGVIAPHRTPRPCGPSLPQNAAAITFAAGAV